MIRTLLAPRLLGLHVLAVAATAAAVLLGLWQLGAWQAGREDQAAARADADPVPLTSVLSPDDPFPGGAVGQPVELSGRWLPGSTMYVAGRDLDGRRGVWAVTPVAVCPADPSACAQAPAMLVVRGWAATRADAPAAPTGAVDVTGWLQPGEGSGRPDPDPGDDVLPELRLADAVQRVDQDLYGGYVIAERTSPAPAADDASLEAVTPASLPEPPAFTNLRNLLYALEWWVFAGFALFLWIRWCRDELDRHRLVESASARPETAGDPIPDDAGRTRVNEVTGVPSGS